MLALGIKGSRSAGIEIGGAELPYCNNKTSTQGFQEGC
jgi:hypothetical protein